MSEDKVVESKPIPQSTLLGSGGNLGQRNRGGWNRVPPRNPPKPKAEAKTSGSIEELSDVVFDCEDGKQSANFEELLDKLAVYLGGKFEHGGEVLVMVKALEAKKLKKPDPVDKNADEVDKAIWTLDLAAWVKKRNKIDDNMKRGYSIVWGQCSEYMKAKL